MRHCPREGQKPCEGCCCMCMYVYVCMFLVVCKYELCRWNQCMTCSVNVCTCGDTSQDLPPSIKSTRYPPVFMSQKQRHVSHTNTPTTRVAYKQIHNTCRIQTNPQHVSHTNKSITRVAYKQIHNTCRIQTHPQHVSHTNKSTTRVAYKHTHNNIVNHRHHLVIVIKYNLTFHKSKTHIYSYCTHVCPSPPNTYNTNNNDRCHIIIIINVHIFNNHTCLCLHQCGGHQNNYNTNYPFHATHFIQNLKKWKCGVGKSLHVPSVHNKCPKSVHKLLGQLKNLKLTMSCDFK